MMSIFRYACRIFRVLGFLGFWRFWGFWGFRVLGFMLGSCVIRSDGFRCPCSFRHVLVRGRDGGPWHGGVQPAAADPLHGLFGGEVPLHRDAHHGHGRGGGHERGLHMRLLQPHEARGALHLLQVRAM